MLRQRRGCEMGWIRRRCRRRAPGSSGALVVQRFLIMHRLLSFTDRALFPFVSFSPYLSCHGAMECLVYAGSHHPSIHPPFCEIASPAFPCINCISGGFCHSNNHGVVSGRTQCCHPLSIHRVYSIVQFPDTGEDHSRTQTASVVGSACEPDFGP